VPEALLFVKYSAKRVRHPFSRVLLKEGKYGTDESRKGLFLEQVSMGAACSLFSVIR
jgi:hypothetical protein